MEVGGEVTLKDTGIRYLNYEDIAHIIGLDTNDFLDEPQDYQDKAIAEVGLIPAPGAPGLFVWADQVKAEEPETFPYIVYVTGDGFDLAVPWEVFEKYAIREHPQREFMTDQELFDFVEAHSV